MKAVYYLKLLGLEVEDRVTGFKGVITSIAFDLYGCIQAVVTPKIQKDGKTLNGSWFDVSRLNTIGDTPVMDVPNFEEGLSVVSGPADKPAR